MLNLAWSERQSLHGYVPLQAMSEVYGFSFEVRFSEKASSVSLHVWLIFKRMPYRIGKQVNSSDLI